MSDDGEFPVELWVCLLAERHQRMVADLAAAEGDEYRTLRALFLYCLQTGVPQSLVAPVMARMGALADDKLRAERKRDGKGGAPRPSIKAMSLCLCAATVTALKDRKVSSVEDALRKVARASAIDQSELRNFRDNLNRGLQSPVTIRDYKTYLAELADMPEAQFQRRALDRLKHLREFVTTPASSNM